MTKAKELPDPALTSEKKLVIPVGPRFQAVIPDWGNFPNKGTPVVAADVALRASIPSMEEMVCKYKKEESDTSKWLGTLVWPRPTDDNLENKEVNEALVGKGRNKHCSCRSPGSFECVKRHIKEESMKLKSELETAFNVWKFDEMGGEVSQLWNTKDQKKFRSLVKTCLSKGKSFMKPALASFPSKNRRSIVNYYFNVHIPQRIRSNSITINTDDEDEEEEEEEEEEVTAPRHSRKRNRAKKAEALALKIGLRWCLDHGFHRVTVESDSRLIIQMVKETTANLLANMAEHCKTTTFFTEAIHLPSKIASTLKNDVVGEPNIRIRVRKGNFIFDPG
ncbi:hypothetical protein KY290_029347 [Solanum tuberosum]|uniref:ELM2 domain-containing protein n=1 Tax=Solanum tuberosum TaxID=4113 RepID=A0ABQ7UNP2_SOLTU|nr:hypothetical protein KY290_029347 [Solanum tuberosum]